MHYLELRKMSTWFPLLPSCLDGARMAAAATIMSYDVILTMKVIGQGWHKKQLGGTVPEKTIEQSSLLPNIHER